MSWEEFLERYVNNYEEFVFKYRNYRIELLYGPKSKGFSYYLLENKKVVSNETYDSPQILLESFRIDGNLLEDIWYDLEWRQDITLIIMNDLQS